jgi:hypothetical protein
LIAPALSPKLSLEPVRGRAGGFHDFPSITDSRTVTVGSISARITRQASLHVSTESTWSDSPRRDFSCVAVHRVTISPRHGLSVSYRRMDGIATCNGSSVQSRVNPLIFMVSVSFHPLIRVIFNFRSRYLFAIGLPFQYLALDEIQHPYSDCTSKQPYSDLKAIRTNLSNRSDYHRL